MHHLCHLAMNASTALTVPSRAAPARAAARAMPTHLLELGHQDPPLAPLHDERRIIVDAVSQQQRQQPEQPLLAHVPPQVLLRGQAQVELVAGAQALQALNRRGRWWVGYVRLLAAAKLLVPSSSLQGHCCSAGVSMSGCRLAVCGCSLVHSAAWTTVQNSERAAPPLTHLNHQCLAEDEQLQQKILGWQPVRAAHAGVLQLSKLGELPPGFQLHRHEVLARHLRQIMHATSGMVSWLSAGKLKPASLDVAITGMSWEWRSLVNLLK